MSRFCRCIRKAVNRKVKRGACRGVPPVSINQILTNSDRLSPIAARAPEVFYDGSRPIDALLQTFRQNKLSSVYALDIIVSNVEIVKAWDGCVAKVNRQVTP
ncbi:hypothetical protein N8912_04670, partial [Rhodobacteraceae bacterium]|nr:hypothetical protein [Paracoccaceae bacterium]